MVDNSIKDLCRICVERSEEYIGIYDKVVPDNTPFFCIINDVCQLDISEGDGFPEYVCKECFLKISEFMVFKRKSHEAKLNFLSMTVSLAEESHPKDSVDVDSEDVLARSIIVEEGSPPKDIAQVDNEAVVARSIVVQEESHPENIVQVDDEALVATSILVKEMTAEGMTLDIAQPGDIIEEVITMPFVVDYEEVVTAENYSLGDGEVFEEEVQEEEVLSSPVVAENRNSKEREVAIILADGGSGRIGQGGEASPLKDTGQEGKRKKACKVDEEEESLALKRRSFVAQAYYRSYLLEKERKVEEGGVEEDGGVDDEGQGVEVEEDDDSRECEDAVAAIAEDPEEDMGAAEEEPGSPTIVEVDGHQSPGVVLTAPGEVVSQEREEASSKAVCCKRKMLAISKSLALSRSLEQPEVRKPGIDVVVGDVDSPMKACGSREGARAASPRNSRTPKSLGETVTLAKDKGSRVEKDSDVTASGRPRRNPVTSFGMERARGVLSKAEMFRIDRRGVAKGPRFIFSNKDPLPPPKKSRRESIPASEDAHGLIQVIASEELRSKGQQFDLEQVGDILKTSLLGKKKNIQVSEVGPTGNVFHVEPTVVKLKGMPMAGARHNHMLRSTTKGTPKRGLVNIVWDAGACEQERGDVCAANGTDDKVEGVRERRRCGMSALGASEAPGQTLTPPAAGGSDAIAILRDSAPKTLLLTAPKEDSSHGSPLAIFLRPLKQEAEEEEGGMGQDDQVESTKSVPEGAVEVKQEVESGEEEGKGSQEAEVQHGDTESFCNRIRRRAKRALLRCMKRKLDELERMQQMGGQLPEEPVVFLSEEAEEVEVQTMEEMEQEAAAEDPIYTCELCGQSSYSKGDMAWHMKAHAVDKQPRGYFCTQCEICFTKHYMYRLHMEMHKMVQGDGAITAGEEGGETEEMDDESVRLPSRYPRKCHYCDAVISGKTALLYHEALRHNAAPIFPCPICSRKFLCKEKMEEHQSLCCGNRIECEVCHKEYHYSSIVQHMRTHRGEKPYLCAECGKTFSQKGDLKRHTKQIHLGMEPLKPFLCSFCPKTFTAQSKLRVHERSHTKEKPFECNECGRSFAHLSTLRRHRENREIACLPVIEQAAKPYTCSICKKGWDQKYALTKHIAWVHERKRPSRTFSCSYCSKVYYCQSQLTYHERTHTKEKPYVCEICDKSFSYNSLRKTHMEKEHGLRRNMNEGPR